ncbi:MAG: M1 family metallopeptidase [Gammaproteobacteria bacterium]|nr:M1 family metallopeptidase [Gammaproteobacteria bacterium]MBT8094257.1 M1 family metallopeptidase [Gammaproteobacteria bacterium]MBT8104490.1 M1 family metallopeptidase [Gammaproteobacteria bacterium]NNK24504.1 M1 family metallopeptidase [Woeseiaceae bacterium]
MQRILVFVSLVIPIVTGCSRDEEIIDTYDPARDYFTYADTEAFVTEHLALNLEVDFDASVLRGYATLTMRRVDPAATDVVLDTRDLDIASATVIVDGRTESAGFATGERHDTLGAPLSVAVPADTGERFDLVIEYATRPESTALQWLPPELTAGGRHPMMFSQSQAVHARSWVPLQDTPSVRITYDAIVRTPASLLAVMSADNDPLTPRTGEYRFDMPQPIPSYLLAIAVGNFYFAPLGEDTGIYTEPQMLDASVFEFADTQAMLDTAETMYGPYEWGRYDLLILPPSFPYGGMENPRLSFITPSLLAGDRSLVSVIAHELAHSWSGNLVTNATWRDGWLNEGMTSYIESRLMEVIYDVPRVDEERVIMYRELLLDLERVPEPMQALAPRLDDANPDDFQGTIHYSKGQLFLEYLEKAFGREVFDAFLQSYFEAFAFGTITTEQFLDYLDAELLGREGSPVSRAQAERWVYEAGLPADAPVPTSENLDNAQRLAGSWAAGDTALADVDISAWSPHAKIHFINSLPADLSQAMLAELDAKWQLSETTNAEMARTWFIQVAARRYTDVYAQLEAHLNRYGRGRLIAPVYRALMENGEDAQLAREMFERARHAYHPITAGWIEMSLDRG